MKVRWKLNSFDRYSDSWMPSNSYFWSDRKNAFFNCRSSTFERTICPRACQWHHGQKWNTQVFASLRKGCRCWSCFAQLHRSWQKPQLFLQGVDLLYELDVCCPHETLVWFDACDHLILLLDLEGHVFEASFHLVMQIVVFDRLLL